MRRFVSIVIITCGIILSSTVQVGGQQPQVQVIGLEVYSPSPTDPSEAEVGGFGKEPGTSLYLKISGNNRIIVAIDKNASKLLRFVDDTKRDLSKERASEGPRGFGFRRSWLDDKSISKDGKTCIVQVSSQQTPHPKASELALKANIVLSCGASEKSEQLENIALKVGTEFKVGDMTIKIDNVEKPEWGEDALTVELSTSGDLAKIKALDFIDTNGQKIESRQTGWGRSGGRTTSKSFNLKKKADTVTLAVTYFEKVEQVKIPLDLRAGIGLAQPRIQALPAVKLPTAVPSVITVEPPSRATPVPTPSAKIQPEKLDPATAKREYHRKAARVVGALNLPSEVIKELLLREKY